MRTSRLLLVVALLALAGCSGASDPGPPEFDVAVTGSETAGIEGEAIAFEALVEHVDGGSGNHTVSLVVDGENVTSETVALDRGTNASVRLAHAFDEPGQYTVAIANQSFDVTVQSVLDAVREEMASVETVHTNETIELVMRGDGDVVSIDLTGETRYDRTTDVATVTAEVVGEEPAGTFTIEFDRWNRDGVSYSKEFHPNSNRTVHWRDDQSAAEFLPDVDALLSMADGSAPIEHRGQESIYVVEVEDASSVVSNASLDLVGFAALENATVELAVNDGTHHVTAVTVTASTAQEIVGTSVEGDVEHTVRFVRFDEPVDVEVPDDVLEATT